MMAILISRSPAEVNQYQHQNGIEWSRNEQNRLAGTLEASQARANLRNEIGVFQVERGDTLGAIAKGLTGAINWSQGVDYRSNRLAGGIRPSVLNEADLIYPGQYVWVENNVIVVADELPSNTVAPADPAPVPNQRPNGPVAPSAPLVLPTQGVNPFSSLPNTQQSLLNNSLPANTNLRLPTPTDRFETRQLNTTALPDSVSQIVASAGNYAPQTRQLPYLMSYDFDNGNLGSFIGSSQASARPNFFTGNISSIQFSQEGLIVLNATNTPDSLRGVSESDPYYQSVILNEYSHYVTQNISDTYLRAYLEKNYLGQHINTFPTNLSPILDDMVSDFSHPFIPNGIYGFGQFNELQSNAFSISAFPQFISHFYPVFGELPIDGLEYELNRDFTALHLSEFLRDRGYGDHSMNDINLMFRRLYSAHNTSNDAEVRRLMTEYHLEDPDFFAFIQPRYQAVGEAFYTHLSNKINAV